MNSASRSRRILYIRTSLLLILGDPVRHGLLDSFKMEPNPEVQLWGNQLGQVLRGRQDTAGGQGGHCAVIGQVQFEEDLSGVLKCEKKTCSSPVLCENSIRRLGLHRKPFWHCLALLPTPWCRGRGWCQTCRQAERNWSSKRNFVYLHLFCCCDQSTTKTKLNGRKEESFGDRGLTGSAEREGTKKKLWKKKQWVPDETTIGELWECKERGNVILD